MTIDELNRNMSEQFPGETLVFGDGPANPRLMLIGEAPGKNEALQGKPFVGKAGQNLTEFLTLVHLNRQDIYVSNTVKKRPFEIGETGRERNRPPTKGEIAAFLPFLMQEIRIIRPQILVTLGNVPLKAVCADDRLTIGQVHGQMLQCPAGYPLFALYHPASVIYRRELKSVYENDVKKLAELLLA